ncbi:MAG: hypothetical protein FJX68_12715 [Alphaproteobacteria bacterium]|nr:hypothetical protein [Alphaproteobacteria bacterium]
MAIYEHNLVTLASYDYETVAAGQTNQVIGVTGATGDRLERVLVAVTTAATSTFSIIDGSTTVFAGTANIPIGVYDLTFQLLSTAGSWKATTGAGVALTVIGRFT